jgi:carboxymethylenebutenolidase
MSDAFTCQARWTDIGHGGNFQGYLALPPSGSGPGLVLFQEIFGINAHIRAVAQQYALDGFVVLAPDVFWRERPRAELCYDEEGRATGRGLASRISTAELEADIRLAVSATRALGEVGSCKVGVIGYCLGGRLAYLAAALAGVDAAVSYYGGGIHQRLELATDIHAPLLLHYAENDANIPLSAVDKVRETLAERAQVHVYANAHHGFNCWERSVYDPQSAVKARARSLTFLGQHLYTE